MSSSHDRDAAEELAALEGAIVRLKRKIAARPALGLVVEQDTPTYASYAKALLDGRARVQNYLPLSYFGDPALDMLLDLFVAFERGEQRTFKTCAIASRVPPATACRYVDLLVRDNMVARRPDLADKRRTIVELTVSAADGMRAWLTSIASIPLRREWQA